ncbi:MAG: hypothetical protein FWC34_12090 [Bacteroidetes bacterium]|nr:hypothetical protein [Bacteroidota bacterium]MCL2301936.1 hypothetical protein [Lentimicrobiaceae bacterium]
MEANLKQLLNDDIKFNLSETNYIIPISDDSIREKLLIDGKETIRTCLQKHDVKLLNDYDKCIEDLVTSEAFFIKEGEIYKPDKSGNTEDPKGYYVENQNYKDLNGDMHDIRDILQPSIKYITGGRGIGKTLTMNILLLRNFDFLCKNKIVFIRCDIKKFLDLKQKERTVDGKEEFSIADYIDCQLLYILCEQLDLDFYKEIASIFDDKTYKYTVSKDHTSDNLKYRERSIVEQLNKYQKLIKDYQKLHNENYARQVIINSKLLSPYEGSTRAYNNWINLSKEIQQTLRKKGYRFWAIIDGMDNINKYDNNGNLEKEFDKMIEAAIDYIRNKEKKYFIWVLMRNNTYQILKSKVKSIGSHQLIKEDDRYKFNIEKLKKEDVIKERDRVFSIKKDYLKNVELPEGIENLYQLFFQKELIKKSHHIRNYIFNWINFLFWHAIHHKKYKTSTFSENFYYSNLILNERLFLDTQNAVFQKKHYSDILFNIFYYNANEIKRSKLKIWHGWCAIRIMQFIQSYGDNGIKEEKLVSKLVNLFSYDKKQVKLIYRHLIMYGFIRYTDGDVLTIKATNGGKELIDFIFSHLEILYYCALDTPLPYFCVKNGHITSHSNSYHIKDFTHNCVKTTTTFLNFLDFQHEEEMKRLKQKNKQNEIKIFINPLDDDKIAKSLHEKIEYLLSKKEIYMQ